MREVPGPSRVEIPFSVLFSNKTCLVVDASRHLNQYVKKKHNKIDSLEDFATLVDSGDWISVDDLDSGYWHVPLHPSMSEFFGCHLTKPETQKVYFYQWKVLFLGLRSAVTIYTQMLAPVAKYLRNIS